MRSHHALHILTYKKTVNNAVVVIAIVEPLMTAPQIYQLWSHRSAENISLFTWSFYLFAAFIWLAYGLSIRNKPVIVSSSLWVLFEGAMVLGIILFS